MLTAIGRHRRQEDDELPFDGPARAWHWKNPAPRPGQSIICVGSRARDRRCRSQDQGRRPDSSWPRFQLPVCARRNRTQGLADGSRGRIFGRHDQTFPERFQGHAPGQFLQASSTTAVRSEHAIAQVARLGICTRCGCFSGRREIARTMSRNPMGATCISRRLIERPTWSR